MQVAPPLRVSEFNVNNPSPRLVLGGDHPDAAPVVVNIVRIRSRRG